MTNLYSRLAACFPDPARPFAHLQDGTVASYGDVEAEQAETQPTSFATVERGDDDLAAILYTSGTTGRSKGAMLSHDNLGSNAFMLREAWAFTGDDVLLHALPIFHTHGLFVATNTILAAGGSMISPDSIIGSTKMPSAVPQSFSLIITSCATSTRRRVR